MMKNFLKILLSVVLLTAVVITPITTNAGGLTDQQVNAIISLLQSFGADSTVVENVSVALTGKGQVVADAPVKWCYDFNKNLRIEMTNEEVTALQVALGKEGLFEGEDKGYFGERTSIAVSEF